MHFTISKLKLTLQKISPFIWSMFYHQVNNILKAKSKNSSHPQIAWPSTPNKMIILQIWWGHFQPFSTSSCPFYFLLAVWILRADDLDNMLVLIFLKELKKQLTNPLITAINMTFMTSTSCFDFWIISISKLKKIKKIITSYRESLLLPSFQTCAYLQLLIPTVNIIVPF